MKIQKIYGDWYALTPTCVPDENLNKVSVQLERVPGVQLLESETGSLMSIDIHRTHLPLMTESIVTLEGPSHCVELDCRTTKQTREGLSFLPPFELRDYQLAAIRFVHERQGSLLLHGLGLGKTIMALCACNSPSLAVVPAAAITVWEIEAAALGMRTRVIRGRKPDLSLLKGEVDLFISTYNSVPNWVPFFKKLSVGPELHTVILDEAHFVHKVGLSWAEGLFALGRRHTIALTGTPARNRLQSLYGVLTALQGTPRPWGRPWEFRIRYCGAARYEFGLVDGRPTHQRELAARLSEVAIGVDWTSPEVRGLRPKLQRVTQRLELGNRERAALSEEALKMSLRGGKVHTLTWLGEQRKAIGYKKLEAVRKLYPEQQFDKDDHLRAIWWCWHKAIAAKLAAHFRESQMCPVDLVTGSTTSKSRARVLKEWKYGDLSEPRILVATLASMSAACNLVTASAAYFLEYDWAPLNIIQAEKRHHRPGSKFFEVWSYYFYLADTLEQKILHTLLDKLTEQEEVLVSTEERDQISHILGQTDEADEDILEQVALSLVR